MNRKPGACANGMFNIQICEGSDIGFNGSPGCLLELHEGGVCARLYTNKVVLFARITCVLPADDIVDLVCERTLSGLEGETVEYQSQRSVDGCMVPKFHLQGGQMKCLAPWQNSTEVVLTHRASADCSDGTKAAVSWMHVPSPRLIKASTSAGTGPDGGPGEKIR
ncbi:hypothetical protein EVAR_99784_1 [Eumeta japonica]|uniref:Uncharacterized protein n=1 Tax=Eumeta variegata TaxID=151549 RepID=A0A4C2AAQ0_EUMVA|nr:hypothetical protein EVAR_99784_1 [Eumeta japonica]